MSEPVTSPPAAPDAMQIPAGLTPYLNVGKAGAAAAIDFYRKAFGAEELSRVPAEDGRRLMHALRINGSNLFLADYFPDHGYPEQTPGGLVLHLQVDDADRWAERAASAGCSVTVPVAQQFWGDRYGQVKDPFGFTWSIGASPKG